MNAPRQTNSQPKQNARQSARQRREEHQQKIRRRRIGLIGLAVLAVVLAGVGIVALVANRSSPAVTGQTQPRVSTERGAIVVDATGVVTPIDQPDWPHGAYGKDVVVVSLYTDYLCPFCGLFELSNGQTLDRLREAGEIVVAYHRVSILDRYSAGSQFPTRSAAAAFHVAEHAPEAFLAFNEALFAHQPEEGTAGLTDDQIAGLARQAGAPLNVVQDIAAGNTPRDWVQIVTERASQDLDGQLATPTVLLNGIPLDTSVYDWRQPGVLEQAIQEARSRA